MELKAITRKTLLILILFVVAFVSNINKVAAQMIITYAGTADVGYNGENLKATDTRLDGPAAGVIDASGTLYFTDVNGNRVRKISPAGIVTTIAGTGESGYTADGEKAFTARITQPAGIVVDAAGNVYFSERVNNVVRKVDKVGILTTVAGNATGGFSGNGGPATKAQLQSPGALAIDKEGNLYIADADNNCIRKVSTTGVITMYAGNGFAAGTGTGGYSGDGGKAILAKLNQPDGLSIDNEGNLLISDCFNHCIRKVDKQGIISTIAGTGNGGYNGDNGKAKMAMLQYPYGIAVDKKGYIYVADHGNNRIRMIDGNGFITTIAGSGTAGYEGEGGPAVNALINKPTFVTISAAGDIYIGDNQNGRIRVITYSGSNVIVSGHQLAPAATHVSAGSVSSSASGQ